MAFQQYNVYDGLTACRVVALANQAGTYVNGTLNNGVGATLSYTAAGAITIDGVILDVGDSVALTGQTNGWENGIYVVTNSGNAGAGGVLQRRGDMQCIEQLKAGQWTSIGAGTVSAGSMFVVAEPLPQIFGVSVLTLVAVIPAGLGTASTKAASAPANPSVASVVGATVIGDLASFNDVAGSVVDSGFGSINLLQYAKVAITAAQFNGMYAAPKLLLANPGANKLIVVHKLDLVMTFVSANYAAGGIVAAQYDSTVNGAGVLATNSEAAADFFAAASTTFQFTPSIVLAPFTTSVNKGIYLSNQTQAFTTGDSTWEAHLFYSIIPTV